MSGDVKTRDITAIDRAADEAARSLVGNEHALLAGAEGEKAQRKNELEIAAHMYASARDMGRTRDEALEIVGSGIDGFHYVSIELVEKHAAEIQGDPWSWLRERARNGSVEVLRELLRDTRPESGATPSKPTLGQPKAPDWVIPGVAARKRRTLASASSGAAKTKYLSAEIKAGLNGGTPLIGEPVAVERVLFVSGEEDHEQIGTENWGPLGFTEEDLAKIHFFGRGGDFSKLGTEEGNRWIEREVEDWRPDLIVLDTSATTIDVRVLDNDHVAEVFDQVLNPLIGRTNAALVFTHHERKSGAAGNRADAAIGAVQWHNQADIHITLANVGKYSETPLENGHVATRSAFVIRRPKGRGGLVDKSIPFEVRGEKDRTEGATLNLRVTPPETEFSDAEQLAAACEGETSRQGLATALGWDKDGTGNRFRKALDEALDEKLLGKVSKGTYAPGESSS